MGDMLGVLEGFATLAAIIVVGYLVGRSGVLGDHAQYVLGRVAFFVLSPFFLFTVLAEADLHVLFSGLLPVSFLAAVLAAALFAVIVRLFFAQAASQLVIGMLASGYTNAGYIGIPVALYVLGEPAYAAPITLVQLLVFAPVALAALDMQRRGSVSVRRILVQPVTNPIILGSVLGLLVALLGAELPQLVMEPAHVIGAAAVPVVLLAFGMSLHGRTPLAAGTARAEVVLATVMKLVVMPVVAWLVGWFVFGLHGQALFAVVLLAALPTAQNVYNYAQRYDLGVVLARDVVFLTTVLSPVALVAVAALLAPR